jgi:3-dehydroquinate synthase
MHQSTVQVYLGPRTYEIVIDRGSLPAIAAQISSWREQATPSRPEPGKAAIVTDSNIRRPHAETVERSLTEAGWETRLIEVPPGETSKNIEAVIGMYREMVALRADRRTVVIAVGGGVIGDSAGFLAATYARGIPFVQIPTSLLAMVDSSVGGKVGVNLPEAKNLVGAFHQPLGVFIDLSTLDSLPEREYVSGLAEVVKYGVIQDPDFFQYLEVHVEPLRFRDPKTLHFVISKCCRLKADVVERDEFEQTDIRATLNYGHTFAHAFEALAGYGQLLHGEAVAIGMVYASRLAERLGRIESELTQRQIDLLNGLGLPVSLPAGCSFSADDILGKMLLDKKTVEGRLRFVLPDRLGHVETVPDVSEQDVRSVLASSA